MIFIIVVGPVNDCIKKLIKKARTQLGNILILNKRPNMFLFVRKNIEALLNHMDISKESIVHSQLLFNI